MIRSKQRRIDLPAPIHLNKHRVCRDFNILILIRGITEISHCSHDRIFAAPEHSFLHAAILALIFETGHFLGDSRLAEVRPDGLMAENVIFII